MLTRVRNYSTERNSERRQQSSSSAFPKSFLVRFFHMWPLFFFNPTKGVCDFRSEKGLLETLQNRPEELTEKKTNTRIQTQTEGTFNRQEFLKVQKSESLRWFGEIPSPCLCQSLSSVSVPLKCPLWCLSTSNIRINIKY